jgi:hypothetical protein
LFIVEVVRGRPASPSSLCSKREEKVFSDPKVAGDLRALAVTAPASATLVIFHLAVLAYLSRNDMDSFVSTTREIAAVWISNESPVVLPDIAASLRQPPPRNWFLLAVDGEPVAFTGSHGE